MSSVEVPKVLKKIQKQTVESAPKVAKVLKVCKKINSLRLPEALERSEKNRRKFNIGMTYTDENSKKHNHSVKFGDHERTDFYQHKDETRRFNYVNRLKNTDNPLYPNYWNKNLLNHPSGNLSKAFEQITESLGLNSLSKLGM